MIMGKVIFSFDFEIGWGDITNEAWRRRESNGVYSRLRQVLPDMLKTLDDYEVPVTWATVGAMIEPTQSRDFSYLNEPQSRIVENSISSGKPDTFNGVDLFERVLNARTEHQIACHSYSHIPFDYNGVDGEFVRQDLQRFKQALAQYGITTSKFVFPENTENFYAELLEMGIDKARVPADNFFSNRLLYLLSIAVIPPPTSKESIDNSGVTKHYGSMLFNDVGNPHRIPLLERRVKLGLGNVMSKNHDLHIWAHPFNFSESEPLLKSFKKMISRIAVLRDAGKLQIGLM